MTYAKIIRFCPTPAAPVTEDTAQLYALWFYLRYPSMVEGYEEENDEPDYDLLDDFPTGNLSDWQDERNSRPFPF